MTQSVTFRAVKGSSGSRQAAPGAMGEGRAAGDVRGSGVGADTAHQLPMSHRLEEPRPDWRRTSSWRVVQSEEQFEPLVDGGEFCWRHRPNGKRWSALTSESLTAIQGLTPRCSWPRVESSSTSTTVPRSSSRLCQSCAMSARRSLGDRRVISSGATCVRPNYAGPGASATTARGAATTISGASECPATARCPAGPVAVRPGASW